MTRRALWVRGITCLAGLAMVCQVHVAYGAALDKSGDITLGLRAYSGARVQTEQTDHHIILNPPGTDPENQLLRTLTFPISPAGHVRQMRWFVEAEFKHDIMRLYKEGFGPLSLLHNLPFKFNKFKYTLVYRGEGDFVFDLGPSEFRTAEQFNNPELVPSFSGNFVPVGFFRHRMRSLLTSRNRLFQAFIDLQAGDLFLRIGRQILVWGETDAFRLLDNINPIDNGFGGFLIPLDERRVPLDMLRVNYYFGAIPGTPLYEAYLEGYAVWDKMVGWSPGINIKGSAWALPNLGEPSATQRDIQSPPGRAVQRGGVQFKFNATLPLVDEVTFGLAYQRTFVDTPRVQTFVGTEFPIGIPDPTGLQQSVLALTEQTAPSVDIFGGTTTFAVPSTWSRKLRMSGQPIIRSELAYFHNEPRHDQAQLDPFLYALVEGCKNKVHRFGQDLCTGGRRTGDSWNFVLGIDTNQFIPFLNERQSFFITTQFFYKHLRDAVPRKSLANLTLPGAPTLFSGEVLPVPADRQRSKQAPQSTGASQPNLVHHPVNQYLQTLLISTAYASGQIVPSLILVYDWSGAFAAIPALTLSRDPFRFKMSYSYLTANRLKGASGVSLLRDRDNILFQIEYVI